MLLVYYNNPTPIIYAQIYGQLDGSELFDEQWSRAVDPAQRLSGSREGRDRFSTVV